jgi:1,4-dihydroxy-2-naphthoate octaprenyltransferase
MSDAVLWLGVLAFAIAFAVGAYLTLAGGWPILAFALAGGAAAIFYVAPPIRWAYRGLGELVIALSYGPWMVLGSLYLHTRTLSPEALVASLVPGCLIMALAVVNAIPDYHQDRLVGKRNLVVRLGRRRAVSLYLTLAAAGLVVVPIGVALGLFPVAALAALLALPLLVKSGRAAVTTFESPRAFVPAVRAIVACYLVAVLLFTAGILASGIGGWPTA